MATANPFEKPAVVDVAQPAAEAVAPKAVAASAKAPKQQRLAADGCRVMRHVYDVILKTFSAHPVLAYIGFSAPTLFMITMVINDTTTTSVRLSQAYSGAVFSIFSVTLLSWILACVSVHFILPNVLVFPAMVHSALGYWSLVNTIVLLFAGWNYLTNVVITVLFSWLVPLIAAWLFAADLMRYYRRRMLERIDAAQNAAQVLANAMVVAKD